MALKADLSGQRESRQLPSGEEGGWEGLRDGGVQ